MTTITITAVVAARMSTITTATTPPMMATVLSEFKLAGTAAVCGGGVVIDALLPPGPTGSAKESQMHSMLTSEMLFTLICALFRYSMLQLNSYIHSNTRHPSCS